MLTKKQNFLETLKPDGKPDRLVNAYEALNTVMVDPLMRYTRGNRVKGTTSKDQWGTTYLWPETQMFAFPSEENKVVPDITKWRETVHVPDLAGHCSDPALWEDAKNVAAKIDRNEQLVMSFMGTGVFEQTHNLMGIEDACVNTILEPEALHELLDVIGEYRFAYTKLLVDNLHPDIIISHDDWGNKTSLFISPEAWREFIKPQFVKMYKYMKDNGVIVIHHADSYCEPIAEDMVELGVDLWQGVLPTNNILKLQKELNGRMTLMGGIDSWIDRVDSTEEEIRKEVRRACETYGPGGHFIPSLTYGLPGALFKHVDPILEDEINRYNKEVYGI